MRYLLVIVISFYVGSAFAMNTHYETNVPFGKLYDSSIDKYPSITLGGVAGTRFVGTGKRENDRIEVVFEKNMARTPLKYYWVAENEIDALDLIEIAYEKDKGHLEDPIFPNSGCGGKSGKSYLSYAYNGQCYRYAWGTHEITAVFSSNSICEPCFPTEVKWGSEGCHKYVSGTDVIIGYLSPNAAYRCY